MNKAHQKMLQAIFKQPLPASLEWKKIEVSFEAIGVSTIEGAGSRVRFEFNGVIGTFHRPHPQKEAKLYQVRDARAFLEKIGVRP